MRRRSLTLISAPAGFGKTTLLSAWISQSKPHLGWVSLDNSDNDPTQFWAYFISALQRFNEHMGESALELLKSPQALPIASVLTSLINNVAESSSQIIMVLDDYHFIEHEPIHQGLTFLIDHLPVNMRLIITTRADPPLPLTRLRARHQLTEIRANDLRFSTDETIDFLSRVMK